MLLRLPIVLTWFLIILLTFFVHRSFGNEKGMIILGQSCALSGPASDLGNEFKTGLNIAFDEINGNGGINGREIILESLDDGYEPYRAYANTKQLIEKGVFALIGEVGTPTSKAVLPLIEIHKIPFFAPYTGADLLRTPFNPYIINIRASYNQEMEKLVSYFVDHLGLTRISCFFQNDSYGFSGLNGLKIALHKRGLTLVSKGEYERNTVAVLGGVLDIMKASPEAVVLVGAYPACAEFIKLYKLRNPKNTAIFGNISFVGTTGLKNALESFGEHVVVTEVVPFPWDRSRPIVSSYINALRTHRPSKSPGFVSLEGYIAGKLFGYIAGRIEGRLTREAFLKKIPELGSFQLDDFQLMYQSGAYVGSTEVILIKLFPDYQQVKF
ncbi:MAG: leucine/isoleucine/valine-binding protein [Desulfobulbaceae bacterium]|nr:MAG: leucine/isoleucine/valine-binding protein [Desulfobulbaceae bacterium]